jgi:hypothetical protein
MMCAEDLPSHEMIQGGRAAIYGRATLGLNEANFSSAGPKGNPFEIGTRR